MSAFLANLAARLAVAVINWWAQRRDIRNSERSKIALEAVQRANEALEWKAGADPDAAARLHDAGGHIEFIGDDKQRGSP